jgi:hypothetical protein
MADTKPRPRTAYLVVRYFEGQPEVRCGHSTHEHATACCDAQAAMRATASNRGAWKDEEGDLHVSSHEWFSVEPLPIMEEACDLVRFRGAT